MEIHSNLSWLILTDITFQILCVGHGSTYSDIVILSYITFQINELNTFSLCTLINSFVFHFLLFTNIFSFVLILVHDNRRPNENRMRIIIIIKRKFI